MSTNNRKNQDKIKRLKIENQRINDEINAGKKKHAELERRMKELSEHLITKNSQLDTLKKRCEETKLQLAEMAANDKRIAAIHELEKVRCSKIQRAVQEHKDMISQAIKRRIERPNHVSPKPANSPVLLLAASCTREFLLGEKERQRDDLKRLLEKREREIVIKKNHNAARIVRLRKLLQTNEGKRALCKEQLAALKAKTQRRY